MKQFLSIAPHTSYQDTGPQSTIASRWILLFEEKERGVIGYVDSDSILICAAGRFELKRGMYFAACGPVKLAGGSGLCLVCADYRPQFSVGGPVESSGRLRYIDGCTDSLLIPPVKMGDPCLNALFFPPGIMQTQHTHPSVRLGLIVSGRGTCLTPAGNIPLVPEMCFVIETDAVHHFSTPTDSGMVVIAYHPDSDFGPQDQNHPMINRTIVGGVSAALIDTIRTK